MKNFNIKKGLLLTMATFGVLTSCQQENDELFTQEKASYQNEILEKGTCDTNEFVPIDAITGTDFNAKISTKIDDRSCSYDYFQSGSYGVYRLDANDNNTGLQVRMERYTPTVQYSSTGSINIAGTVRILEAGNTDSSRATHSPNNMRDNNGSYFAQVKGSNTLNTGSPDPAIMLFIAKPERGDRFDRGRDETVVGGGAVITDSAGNARRFKIYAEFIRKRGGSGPDERRLIFITTVNRNTDFDVSITSRFESNNNHYIDYTINGVSATHKVSKQNTNGDNVVPTNTKIRMGAYRCRGGKANIRWKNDLTRTSSN